MLRPLAFEFPGDAKAWRANFETLVGPDLLAAPVAGPGTTPTVYLPPGSWVDLYSGTKVAGGRSFTRQTPLDQFPLYLRDRAVVPFNLRTAADSWWGVNELTHPGPRRVPRDERRHARPDAASRATCSFSFPAAAPAAPRDARRASPWPGAGIPGRCPGS